MSRLARAAIPFTSRPACSAPLPRCFARGGRLVVVTDESVAALHLATLAAGLPGIRLETIVLPPGEATKDWAHLQLVVERLLELGVERSDAVVALGGGVIGDLVGFACSMLKRGCRFVQVPTTLLAQVDSSVGGKTAINAKAGKNLVGTFHQPVAVLIDPQVLATLPRRELMAGYAEVVKYGLINDAAFFAWCEANGAAVLNGDSAAQIHAIAHSCRAKAAIVAADERETDDIRALLNLGHTFGHAFEAETGFSSRLLHGEAVALGMVQAFRLSARLDLCAPADAERVTAHFADLGFTTEPGALNLDCTAARLVAHMTHDKKMSGGRLAFILARGIGQSFVSRDVELPAVEAFLAQQLAG
jgi:3-dehydroquinate synthase